MRHILLALATAVILSGCAGDAAISAIGRLDAASLEVELAVSSTRPDGAAAFAIAGDAPIVVRLWGSFAWSTDDYNPVEAVFVAEDGRVVPLVVGFEFDGAHMARGDGVAYAGVADVNAGSPVLLRRAPTRVELVTETSLDADRGVLLLLWARQAEGASFHVALPPGTRAHPLAVSSVEALELKDMASGARVGSPALGAHVLDGARVGGEGAVYASLTVLWSDVGTGRVDVDASGFHGSMTLDGRPELARGLSWRQARAHLTSDGPVDISVSYAGNARSTRVFVLVAVLDADAMPRDVWQLTQVR